MTATTKEKQSNSHQISKHFSLYSADQVRAQKFEVLGTASSQNQMLWKKLGNLENCHNQRQYLYFSTSLFDFACNLLAWVLYGTCCGWGLCLVAWFGVWLGFFGWVLVGVFWLGFIFSCLGFLTIIYYMIVTNARGFSSRATSKAG